MPAQAVVYVVVAKFSVLEASAWVYGSVPELGIAAKVPASVEERVAELATIEWETAVPGTSEVELVEVEVTAQGISVASDRAEQAIGVEAEQPGLETVVVTSAGVIVADASAAEIALASDGGEVE